VLLLRPGHCGERCWSPCAGEQRCLGRGDEMITKRRVLWCRWSAGGLGRAFSMVAGLAWACVVGGSWAALCGLLVVGLVLVFGGARPLEEC